MVVLVLRRAGSTRHGDLSSEVIGQRGARRRTIGLLLGPTHYIKRVCRGTAEIAGDPRVVGPRPSG